MSLLVQLASKGKKGLLLVRVLLVRLLFVQLSKADARAVAARFGGETAAAREVATHAAVAREATWSLMRLLLVQLLKLPLLLFVQLSLLVQLAPIVRKRLLVQWLLLVQGNGCCS